MSPFYQGMIVGSIIGFFTASFLFGLVIIYIEHMRTKTARKDYEADLATYRIVLEKKKQPK
jgi:hypothetical protein